VKFVAQFSIRDLSRPNLPTRNTYEEENYNCWGHHHQFFHHYT
jgi:hypothetical protein